MAEKQEMEIEITSEGETKVHVKGIKGKGCMQFVDVFKKILGEVKNIKKTSEFYEPDAHIKTEIRRD